MKPESCVSPRAASARRLSVSRGMGMSVLGAAISLAAMVIAGASAGAVDGKKGDEQAPTVLKTQEGLRFNLPEDWPIEKRGGVLGPIPVEEYLSRKFSAVEIRLRSIEQQVSAFDLRLRVLEEAAKRQPMSSRPPEAKP